MYKKPMMTFLFVVFLMYAATGCSQGQADREVRMTRSYIYYLDGAGGGSALSNWSGGVKDGMRAAGYSGAGEMFKWNTGLGVVADQDSSVEYKRGKAAELAQSIQRYCREHPGAPVTLMGLSAGTSIVVFALEALPASCPVRDVVLLGASISADYDLTRALQRVSERMYVFTSEKDGVLAFMVPLAGTADRTNSPSAGLRGFSIPASASPETRTQYAKLTQIGWRPEFARVGDFGGHTDTVKAPFVQHYIAPLIMAGVDNGAAEPTLAAGKVANPDYVRWARVPVGSSVTLEGYQVLDSVKQPLQLTARLVSKHKNKLVVERRYVFSDRAVPPRVHQFIAEAEIDPEDHPMTSRQAVIRELPSEAISVGGKRFDCRVREVDCPGSFAEWGQNIHCTLYTTDQIPGGLVKISLKASKDNQPFQFVGHVVGTKVDRDFMARGSGE